MESVAAAKQAPDETSRHSVYVVKLDPAAGTLWKAQMANPKRNTALPCVYVGMTGLDPNERFANHKNGVKAARVVQRYGVELLPQLFEFLNPMPYAAAVVMERELAKDLRKAGYTVFGGV